MPEIGTSLELLGFNFWVQATESNGGFPDQNYTEYVTVVLYPTEIWQKSKDLVTQGNTATEVSAFIEETKQKFLALGWTEVPTISNTAASEVSITG